MWSAEDGWSGALTNASHVDFERRVRPESMASARFSPDVLSSLFRAGGVSLRV
jgi:hypothetical protein